MHPAIRRDYMFHNQYQPNPSPTLPPPQNLPQSKPELHQYKPQQFQPPMRPEIPLQQFQVPKQPDAQILQRNYQSSHSPIDATAKRQELQHPSTLPVQYEMQAPKPVYAHQQYFQKPLQPNEYAPPEVTKPTQPQQESYQQLPPLQQLTPVLPLAEEPLAKVAECPPDMSSFTLQLMANLKKVAS